MALYKAPTQGGDVLFAANRARAKASTATKVRSQSPDAEDITLPPPSLAGISTPTGDAKQWRAQPAESFAAEELPKSNAQAEVDGSRADRPGNPTRRGSDNRAFAGDPGDDARALENSERPSNIPTTTPKRKSSGWRPVRQNAPNSGDARPSTR